MGGTFMSLPEDYRDYFIRNLHDALSGHTSSDVHQVLNINIYVLNRKKKYYFTIFKAIEYSERSNTKCIGITIETRPDYCLKRHQSDMLKYGCTRLEIGVQSVVSM